MGEEYFILDKSRYKGEFLKGKKNGKGRMEFEDGSYYEGEFRDDFINGFGKCVWEDG